MSRTTQRQTRRSGVVLAVMFGVLAGLSIATFDYAEGTSYLSNDPRACVNCHVMRDQYDAWRHSAHHEHAACNDCHVPQDVVGKYATKMEHGYRHSKGFTLDNFHEPIRITDGSLRVVEANCVRCHSGLTSEIGATVGVDAGEVGSCTRCHAGAGHAGRR